MSAKDNVVTVGGEPRIDFLPPEIKQKKQAKRLIRLLVVATAGVVALCVLAYIGVTTVAVTRQLALAAEQDRTLALISEQGKYSDARNASATVETARSARLVASAPEILWRDQIAALQATLPEGAAITMYSVSGQSTTALGPATQGVLALPQVAQVTLTATFSSVESVATWQDSVQALPGFAGVWVTPVSDTDGAYEIQATIGIFTDAFAMRLFSPIEAEADATETTESGN